MSKVEGIYGYCFRDCIVMWCFLMCYVGVIMFGIFGNFCVCFWLDNNNWNFYESFNVGLLKWYLLYDCSLDNKVKI